MHIHKNGLSVVLVKEKYCLRAEAQHMNIHESGLSIVPVNENNCTWIRCVDVCIIYAYACQSVYVLMCVYVSMSMYGNVCMFVCK